MLPIDFAPLGEAVDSGRLQKALGFNRARLSQLLTVSHNYGLGAALPDPVGVLGGALIWSVKDLEEALPTILAAQQSRARKLHRTDREPVDFAAVEALHGDFEGVPHVLGWMDAALIARHFGLGQGGARYPGEWASRGRLLPEHAGILGGGRVWPVKGVKEREPLIIAHLARRGKRSIA